MDDVFLFLGNIRTLILSRNRISSTHGLDRMYSLERLAIDENCIEDLRDVAGLANLPNLTHLDVRGNPLEKEDPSGCRVQILNLFRESRFAALPGKFLPRNATYLQLQELLPVLDGEAATKKELLALKDLTFLPSVTPADDDLGEDPCMVDLTVSTANGGGESSKENPASTEWGAENREVTEEGDEYEIPSRPFALAELPSLQQRRTVRCVPTRTANIRDPVAFDLIDLPTRTRHRQPGVRRRRKRRQRHSSLRKNMSDKDVGMLCEVIDDLIGPTISLIGCCAPDTTKESGKEAAGDEGGPLNAAEETMSSEEHLDSVKELPTNDSSSEKVCVPTLDSCDGIQEKPTGVSVVQDEDDVSTSTASRLFEEACVVSSKDAVSPKLSAASASLDDVGSDMIFTDMDAAHDQQEASENENQSVPVELGPDEESHPPISDTGSSCRNDDEKIIDSQVETQLDNAQFPDVLDDEDQKSHSVLDQTSQAETAQTNTLDREYNFGSAERNDVYDGPKQYAALPVYKNLIFYFRFFVFPHSASEDHYSTHEATSNEHTYASLPRIQLFKRDRDVMLANLPADQSRQRRITLMYEPQQMEKEKVVDVWREEVMACGSHSQSRLPPSQIPQRGFHGELVLTNGAESRVSESQRILLCLSDEALYFIPDAKLENDSDSKGKVGADRIFPTPIPRGALFEDASWPHALARHPLKYLKRITIGFQFQRLVLHFVFPKEEDQGDSPQNGKSKDGELDFTYIFFTCNKLRTISLLQKLQAQLKDENFMSTRDKNEVVCIDNDDRIILDGLGVASAPSFIGSVIHYQIVLQKWKHGDRNAVRRVCILTDTKIFLLDETYIGDGSNLSLFRKGECGNPVLNHVDSSELTEVTEIRAADEDPRIITLVIKAPSRLQRSHRWRLVCGDGENAERLIDDVRKAKRSLA